MLKVVITIVVGSVGLSYELVYCSQHVKLSTSALQILSMVLPMYTFSLGCTPYTVCDKGGTSGSQPSGILASGGTSGSDLVSSLEKHLFASAREVLPTEAAQLAASPGNHDVLSA